MMTKKFERSNLCHLFYAISDIVNSFIFILMLLVFLGCINPDINKTLGGIYSTHYSIAGIEDTATTLRIFFIIVCVFYAGVFVVGFLARHSLKKHTNRLYPHVIYLFGADLYLLSTIVSSVYCSWTFTFVLIGLNFVFAMVTSIFGMVVHND